MNDIPVKKIEISEIQNFDFKEFLEKQLKNFDSVDKDFIKRIIEKGQTLHSFDLETIEVLFENLDDAELVDIETYLLSDTFQILNEEKCIRDGVITIGGEASTGKTSFLTALALDILNNNKDTCFLFYSLDDSFSTSARRIRSQLLVHMPKQYIPEPEKNLLKRIVILTKLNLDYLNRQVKIVKQKTQCQKIIIGIDYFQLLGTGIDSFKRREYLNDCLAKLKNHQDELSKDGCILFLLSQFNRNEKSTTYRYRDTSEIENQSDVCLDLSDAEEEIKVKISKNKMGKRNLYYLTSLDSNFVFTPLEMRKDDKGTTSTSTGKPKEFNWKKI